MEKLYVCSRASLPERSAMWRKYRDDGYQIVSTWIDQIGKNPKAEQVTDSDLLRALWATIGREIALADRLILYAERADFPLKGALIELGMGLGLSKPVTLCLPGVVIEQQTYRPLGSWIHHPLVSRQDRLVSALVM